MAKPVLAGAGAGFARRAGVRTGQWRPDAVRRRRQPGADSGEHRDERAAISLFLLLGRRSIGLALAGRDHTVRRRPPRCRAQCPLAQWRTFVGVEQRRQQPGDHRSATA